MSLNNDKLSIKEKLGYATGDFASNLFWQPFTIFLLYYYTDIFGISAAAIGTMFLITRVWDTFFDPIMGMVADRTNTRWGKFRPYLLWMALPFGIIGALTYFAPALSTSGKLVFAYITYTLMMMMYSAVNVPYSALLGVISPNPQERNSASSYKFTLAFMAGFVVQLTTLWMVDNIGKNDSQIIKAQLKDNVLVIDEVKPGSAKIVLSANDNKGGKKETSFLIKVYDKGSNPPKVAQALPYDTLQQGFKTQTIALDKIFSDADGDKLKYTANSDNEKVVKASIINGQLVITEVGTGTALVSVDASDKVGTAKTSFSLSVNANGNAFPTRTAILPDLTLKQGFDKNKFDVSKIFTDANNDKIYYSATTSDIQVVGLTVKGNELSVNEIGPGKSHIILYAYDGKGGVATDTFTVSVEEKGNAVPIIASNIGTQELQKGFGSLQIPIGNVFSDRDGDKLNISATCVNEQKGYFYTMSIFAVIAVILFFVTFVSTKERVQPAKTQKTSLKKDLKDLISNRPWLILFALSLCLQIHVAIRSSSIIFYFKYYIGNTQLAALYLVLGTLASITGAFLVQFLAKKIGKKAAYISLTVLGAFFTIMMYFVTPDQYIMLFGWQILYSITTGPLSPLIWAMYTDSADYSEWKTGRRATGLVLSASVFSLKFGWAIGSAITGWLLAYYGFQANIVQNVNAQTGIRMLLSLIPAITLVLSGLFIIFYKLNEKKMAEIEVDLNKRRAEAGEA